jgi:glycosyltransferase involved in cell wall biosynthesis
MYSLYKFLNNKISSVDIILANHSFTAIPTYLSNLKNITKWYYIQAYEPDFYEDKNISSYILKKLSKITYSFPIKKIVNSPLYYNYKEINSNYFVPPGIDLNVFYAKKNEGISNTRAIKIGCIGRKEPIKGTAHVIQAFEQLLSEKMNVILYIAYGYVPIDADNEKIITVIPKNDKELGEFYRSVDIFITTPIFQQGAYHYPVMEAMASGTPVIHTGYLPGDINNSWIVQQRDTTDIVCKLKEIISANNQQISEKVNQGIKDVQSFSWDAVSNSMADIFLAQER